MYSQSKPWVVGMFRKPSKALQNETVVKKTQKLVD